MEKRNTFEVGRTKCKKEMGASFCDCPKCSSCKGLHKKGDSSPKSLDDVEGFSAQFK